MRTPDAHMLTRRSFLRYSGVTIGGAAFGGLLGPLAEAFPPVAPPDLDLSPGRRATLVAVIGALGSVMPTVDATRADEVVSAIGDFYRRASRDDRETLEVTIDAVDASLEPGEFRRRSVQDRVEILRAGITGRGNPGHRIPGGTSSMQSVLTDNALALVATAFLDRETRWNRDLFLAAA